MPDLPALERAVEEARRKFFVDHTVQGVTMSFTAMPYGSPDDLDALLRAARLAERARCREAVEKAAWWITIDKYGRVDITKQLAAIDALDP